MICLVEALNYRSLRYIRQDMGDFHILVGPNGSGKSTFLDVIVFLGDLVRKGLEEAVSGRTPNYADLTWLKKGDPFELAIEMTIPDTLTVGPQSNCRYEVSLGIIEETEEFGILNETFWLKPSQPAQKIQKKDRFPHPPAPPDSIMVSGKKRGWKKIVSKFMRRGDFFYGEMKNFTHAYTLGPQKSALGNLPEDEDKFPVATWFKRMLINGIQPFILNSEMMRKPSPPGNRKRFSTDGSHLPWAVQRLRTNNIDRFNNWIKHLQTALPDLEDITTFQRPEDGYCYLSLHYKNKLKAPSWMVSDGTLRLLALTIPAYLPDTEGTLLIEEPENGIHPRAIETVFQSLSSVYNGQVLIATHSPILLNAAGIKDIICFGKTDEGSVDSIFGKNHHRLVHWKGDVSLDVLFASGVLD